MPSIDEAWKVAQKLRVAIQKELEHIQKGGQGANEMARFEKVEKLMENYRLACIETIWPDIRAAKEKAAEDALWLTHTQVTKAYRNVLGRLQGHDHVVLRRKVEKLYSTFLKTAQYFYRGYLQRVCARYDMKDLKRIARGAELEEMPVPDVDKVDAAAAQLEEVVKASCHKTLIYLGDLSRYRTLLRPKDRKWDGALAYYFLANDLVPESGYGHHQCAVIYGETEDHLQIVYHLHRALACDMPHPNAPTNLEREFRDLLKRKGSVTKHALVTWFVKLHAFYFQGKEFAERKELESEVDHRLAVAMKTGTGLDSDTDLLKIILINIMAYVIAQGKIRAKWTDEGSRSCQFILLLNIRTINTISRLLGDEIADLIRQKTAEAPPKSSDSSAKGESASKFTPVFTRLLPLLRVYMTWLCAYGSELVEFRAHLEPHLGTMCMTLSNTLTTLFELLGSDTKLGTAVPWRFPEDEMTLGIRCLNGPDLHDGCQLYYDAFTRKPKPRREDVPGANYTTDDDTFTRALDVVFCALDLSNPSSKFPLTTSTTKNGAQELTTVVYLEGGKPDPALSVQAVQHPTSANSGATSALQQTLPAASDQVSRQTVAPLSPCESNELSEDMEFYGPGLRKAGSGIQNVQAQAAAGSTQAAPASELPIDTQLFRILNDFLLPPESAPKRKPDTPSQSHARMGSYGIGSTMAGETSVSAAPASPVPGSAGTKPIPTLPWNYFYTPAPVDPALRNSSAGSTARGWEADGSGSSRPASSGAAATAGNPLARRSHSRFDSFGSTLLMEDQAEALRSLALDSNFNERVGQPPQEYGTRGLWSGAEDGMRLTANPLQHNAWGPSGDPWQPSQGQHLSATNPAPASSFSALDFSNTSSLPPVNSPWGLPAAQRGAAAPSAPAMQSPSSLNPLRAYPGVASPGVAYGNENPTYSAATTHGEATPAFPSPTSNRYATDQPTAGAYAAGMADGYEPRVSPNAWPNVRMPTSGANQPLAAGENWPSPIQKPTTVGAKAEGKPAMENRPKR
ncbi:hypothetical protein VTK56DRAFT_9558 [Thermocarpiscus australiensis]